MLPFQAELYRAIFPHHIAQSRTVLISRADDIRPYSSNRANGFLQRSTGQFFRNHIRTIEPVRISRADDIRPYGGDRIYRFSQRGSGGFFRSYITAIED